MQEAFSLPATNTRRITGLRRLATYLKPHGSSRIPPCFLVFVQAHMRPDWLLTVSPVPKTITSYSSSMLYRRLSRLALFLPWDVKGIEGKNGGNCPRSRGVSLTSAHCFRRLVRRYVLFINNRDLLSTGINCPHTVTGEDKQRWPWSRSNVRAMSMRVGN